MQDGCVILQDDYSLKVKTTECMDNFMNVSWKPQ